MNKPNEYLIQVSYSHGNNSDVILDVNFPYTNTENTNKQTREEANKKPTTRDHERIRQIAKQSRQLLRTNCKYQRGT